MKANKAFELISNDWIGIVAGQVASMQFGVVQITVHDARVVQIEKTEKLRFDPVRKKISQ
jgi:hypothetical protein